MSDKSEEPVRLQKFLANAGLGSRREIEGWISEGRVKVNGQVAKLGDRATITDKITVDDKPVGQKRLEGVLSRVIIYNKPEGEIVSRDDPEGRPTVFRKLPKIPRGRWINVGRLDINSSGLLLFTSDGDLANKLMHPRYQFEREYAVRVLGEVSEEKLEQLVNGVELEDGPARFEEIVESGGDAANRWYHVVIMEGRKREVRRLWQAVGAEVSRLKRVRFGPIILDSSVKAGQWRELTKEEYKALFEVLGVTHRPPGLPLTRPGAKVIKPSGAARPVTPWAGRKKGR